MRTVLLLTDAAMKIEQMFNDIDQLLSTGAVAGLFTMEDQAQVCEHIDGASAGALPGVSGSC